MRTGNDKSQHAFTIIELIVVVAVIALLVFIRVPAMARAANQSKRAQCAANLRQYTLAEQIFANENANRLPTNTAGYWAFDTSWDIGTFVEGTGSKWTVMYCPGTTPRWSEDQNWDLYNYAAPSYRVLGYVNTFPGNPSVTAANLNATLTPAPELVAFGVYNTPLASERVLLADNTMSDFGQNKPAARYTYNYTVIQGGFVPTYVSAHLAGQFPAGGNVGMLDGHVEWRNFDDMTPRTDGSSPVFWW
jgi:prepilin-type N-terminal cleavage/methylation domain-containing protein/prepilin-type processing-associated H-X9-DG protein